MGSKSAQKIARASARRHERNTAVDSQAKTNIARAEKLITAGDAKATQEAVKRAISYLDKAAGKKVLHPNSAARRKSRLLKKINKAASKTKSEKAA